MVWFWMLACGQLILLDQIRTHQVVGTPAIDDDTFTPVVDDKESVKRVVALLLIWLVIYVVRTLLMMMLL